MRVFDLTTNHVKNPLGYMPGEVSFGWKADSGKSKKTARARVMVASEGDIVFDSGARADIDSLGFTPGLSLAPRTRYDWTVSVEGDAGDAASESAWFETGKMGEKWVAKWISPVSRDMGNAVLTKTFALDKEVASARIYACGLGLYELYANGVKVSDEMLTPYCNAYDKWLQTQTYDATRLFKKGDVTLEAALGDGWYKGRFGFQTNLGNTYGDRQAFLMEARVRFTDGTEAVLATDATWTARESRVRFANIYDGEVFDASFEPKTGLPTEEIDIGFDRLTDRLSLPVRLVERIKPKEILRTPAGETVLDLGQEITGYLEFVCDAPKGAKMRLSYGEILQQGNFYNDNLRTAKAEYTYISDGRRAVVRPRFTFFGFRYVKLEGFGENPALSLFTGCVLHSDILSLRGIKTPFDKVNRFAENALWGQRGNFLDVPTDCPQRDERMGWTGDAQAFSGTACFQMDCAAFYRKFLYDMRMEQSKFDGAVPHVIPSFEMGGNPSCAWADAATVIPWTTYLFCGDKALLREEYPGMRDWVEWIYRTDEATGGERLWHVGFHFADWLALDTENGTPIGGTDSYYIASAYYYYSVTLTLKAAKALGYAEDAARYEKLAGEILAAIRKEYFTAGGRVGESTQTAYVIALFMGLAPEEHRAKIASLLENKFRASDGKLRTGFVGTSYLCRALSGAGLNDLAYRLLLNEEYPGWLYEVNMGATTVWERWNSVLPDGSISDTGMNSLNHYAYGAVMEWVYRDVAGLNPVEDAPGFRRALIRPRPNWRMPSVDFSYDSASGRYAVAWSINPDRTFTLRVTVPFDASAECVLPFGDIDALSRVCPGLSFAPRGDDAVCALTAGSYEFHYTPTQPLHETFSLDTPVGRVIEQKEIWSQLVALVPELADISGNQVALQKPVRELEHSPFVKADKTLMGKVERILLSYN